MRIAQRHNPFIANLPSECPRLCMSQMMRLARTATTYEARPFGDVAKMIPIANSPGMIDEQLTLVERDAGKFGNARKQILRVSRNVPCLAKWEDIAVLGWTFAIFSPSGDCRHRPVGSESV